MCKISIITPVYNVEKYLEKNIESILGQTFRDYEFIIVNDGSTDSSGEIAEKYAKKDNRIKVINKENGGAPSARNEGIKIAKGDYLYFPDSDDWLEKDYLENLYDAAVRTNVDLVITGFKMEYYEGNKEVTYPVSINSEIEIYNNKYDLRNNAHKYFDNMMWAVPWNKLYRASYIKTYTLFFPNVKWDDLHFNMECLKNINSFAVINNTGYRFFRSRPGSESTIVFDEVLYKKRKAQFTHILDVYDSWGIKDDNILAVLYGYYAGRIIQCMQEVSISNNTTKKKRELLLEIMNDNLTKVAFKKGKINSKLLLLVSKIMRLNRVNLNLLVGMSIGIVKEKNARLFNYLKATSVNKSKRS